MFKFYLLRGKNHRRGGWWHLSPTCVWKDAPTPEGPLLPQHVESASEVTSHSLTGLFIFGTKRELGRFPCFSQITARTRTRVETEAPRRGFPAHAASSRPPGGLGVASERRPRVPSAPQSCLQPWAALLTVSTQTPTRKRGFPSRRKVLQTDASPQQALHDRQGFLPPPRQRRVVGFVLKLKPFPPHVVSFD